MSRFDPVFNDDVEIVNAVMSAIYYFDIFRHPLREDEILNFVHNRPASTNELSKTLHFLVSNGYLFQRNGFYLPNQEFHNIDRRLQGEKLAEQTWKIARKKAAFIAKFPFVRSVLISGSLSKGFMDENSDIDYFIITNPGRLWLSRTLLALYKKIFLFNSHKHFCINYFIDLDHLKLTDRNLFTATELLFSIPLYNPGIYTQLLQNNEWVTAYYPSFNNNYNTQTPVDAGEKFKKIFEKLLNGKTGAWLDTFCFNITTHFWKKKFHWMNREQFDRDMKSDKSVSKHHPNGFRDRVLQEHKSRMTHFSKCVSGQTGKFASEMSQAINS